jgi:hypothetical protein
MLWSRCLLVDYQLKHMKLFFLSFQPYFSQSVGVSQNVLFLCGTQNRGKFLIVL